eukprot:6137514-Amphidinium_carterae.1
MRIGVPLPYRIKRHSDQAVLCLIILQYREASVVYGLSSKSFLFWFDQLGDFRHGARFGSKSSPKWNIDRSAGKGSGAANRNRHKCTSMLSSFRCSYTIVCALRRRRRELEPNANRRLNARCLPFLCETTTWFRRIKAKNGFEPVPYPTGEVVYALNLGFRINSDFGDVNKQFSKLQVLRKTPPGTDPQTPKF